MSEYEQDENWLRFAVSSAEVKWLASVETEAKLLRTSLEITLTSQCFTFIETLKTFMDVESDSEIIVIERDPTVQLDPNRTPSVGDVYVPHGKFGALSVLLSLLPRHIAILRKQNGEWQVILTRIWDPMTPPLSPPVDRFPEFKDAPFSSMQTL